MENPNGVELVLTYQRLTRVAHLPRIDLHIRLRHLTGCSNKVGGK